MRAYLFGDVPGALFLRALLDGQPAAWVMFAFALVFAGMVFLVKLAFRRMA